MKLKDEQIKRASAIKQALINNGLSGNQLELVMAKVAHETGGFNSRVFLSLNNASGIKWINKPFQPATKGTLSPEGNFYAKYANLNDWAKDYLRILNMGKIKPLQATDTATFAKMLKDKRYYTDTVANYAKGLNRWQSILSKNNIQAIGATSVVVFAFVIIGTLFILHHQKII